MKKGRRKPALSYRQNAHAQVRGAPGHAQDDCTIWIRQKYGNSNVYAEGNCWSTTAINVLTRKGL
jgi:hypothetical protein